MEDIKAKQQVVEKINNASKILVTISENPSVDALSAALGLTLLLDNQKKYATAIFSGETPPAIAFLEPEKTFDDTTDSLRDFIIALNKDKADHLRMPKPEPGDDKVRIFVTPYKSVITENDLEFSQGDYNVELVIALGVDKQENLDAALDNHGQILHDADIITITSGQQFSDLGGIDWHDDNASSLSEMIAGLAEALKTDKKKSLLDGPIATALLTGIVAETERFSNEHTTSNAMNAAAKLMAAGADQQLIATELQNAHEIEAEPEVEVEEAPEEDTSSDDEEPSEEVEEQKPADDGLTIQHDEKPQEETPEEDVEEEVLDKIHEGETIADLDERIRAETSAEVRAGEAEDALEDAKQTSVKYPAIDYEATEPVQQLEKVTAAASPEEVPYLGGTLNATTEQAADDSRREAASDKNKTILSHSYLGGNDPMTPGSEAIGATEPVDPSEAQAEAILEAAAPHTNYAPQDANTGFAVGEERTIQPLSESIAVDPAPNPYAVNPMPVQPAAPVDLGLPLPPPIPDFSNGLPPLPQVFPGAPAAPTAPLVDPLAPTQPELLGDIFAPAPAQPAPEVDYTVNAVANPGTAYAVPEQPVAAAPAPQPVAANPGQFQIPGQQ